MGKFDNDISVEDEKQVPRTKIGLLFPKLGLMSMTIFTAKLSLNQHALGDRVIIKELKQELFCEVHLVRLVLPVLVDEPGALHDCCGHSWLGKGPLVSISMSIFYVGVKL